MTVRSSAEAMVVARPQAAAFARAALPSEVEVEVERPSVLPEEAAAQQKVEARSALAAVEVPRREEAEAQ